MKIFRVIIWCLIGLMLFSALACGRSAKIRSFSASPPSSTAGASAQICYDLVDAVSARIDPNVGELQNKNSSCVNVAPRETTSYTLSASGSDGKAATAHVTVNVEAPPPLAKIVTFQAKRDTTTQAPGTPAELCYEVSAASSLNIKPDIGNVEPLDKGCRTVKPNQTTTYELAATGSDNQTVTEQATVTVVQPPARIVQFDVSPASIKAGEKVRISYHVEDAARARIRNVNYDVKLGTPAYLDIQPKRSTILALEAQNSDGKLEIREKRVTVEQLPVEIVEFKADSTEIEIGQETFLRYKLANADSAELASDSRRGALKSAAEGYVRITPLHPTTYTLTAKDPDGKAISQAITVNVASPAQARILKFDPAVQTITRGNQAKLCYAVTPGSKVSIYSERQKSSRDLTSAENDCITFRPTASDRYRLTATGPNGNPVTAQATVNVQIPPPGVAFVARSAAGASPQILIATGDEVRLCYALANVVEASINPGFGNVEVSERKCLNLNEPEKTTAYTLTAKGIDGTIRTAQVTIRVYPPPEILRFEGQSFNGRHHLCYAFRYGSKAVIVPSIGNLPREQGCVEVPSRSPYTLTVYGRGKVPPAVAHFPPRR